jgi:hypothetical protein
MFTTTIYRIKDNFQYDEQFTPMIIECEDLKQVMKAFHDAKKKGIRDGINPDNILGIVRHDGIYLIALK